MNFDEKEYTNAEAYLAVFDSIVGRNGHYLSDAFMQIEEQGIKGNEEVLKEEIELSLTSVSCVSEIAQQNNIKASKILYNAILLYIEAYKNNFSNSKRNYIAYELYELLEKEFN